MKIAYFGYDFFYDCLERLVADGHEITGVFAFDKVDNEKYDFNTRVCAFARERDIFLYTGSLPIEIPDAVANADLIVTAAYGYKIPTQYLQKTPGINVHPSTLPEGRGCWPLPWIILKQLSQSAVTIHELTPQWDAGKILLQKKFEIAPRETLETLVCKIQMIAPSLISDVLQNYETIYANGIPQIGGSYWKLPTDADRTLDWNLSVEELDRIVRAFGKFESTAHFDNAAWDVQQAEVWKAAHDFTPGTVVHRTAGEVVIAARDGLVCLTHFEKEK